MSLPGVHSDLAKRNANANKRSSVRMTLPRGEDKKYIRLIFLDLQECRRRRYETVCAVLMP